MAIKELMALIKEETDKVDKELAKAAKDTDEVEADEYADTLVHQVDYEKALGIKPKLESVIAKENKAMRMVMALRKQRKALQEKLQKKQIQNENSRLKATISKLVAKK